MSRLKYFFWYITYHQTNSHYTITNNDHGTSKKQKPQKQNPESATSEKKIPMMLFRT